MRAIKTVVWSSVVALTLGGCAWFGEAGVSPIENVNLAAAKYVFATNDYYNPSAQGNSSYLLVLNDNDTVQRIKKANIANERISWSRENLYYADEQNEYFYDGENQLSFPLEKASYQHGVVTLRDGITRVALYQQGTEAGGSQVLDQLVITGPQSTVASPSHERLFHLAACGDSAYAVSRGEQQLTLHQLAEGASLAYFPVASIPVEAEEVFLAGDTAPCGRKQLVFLANQHDAAKSSVQTVLHLWDSHSGGHLALPLVTAEGEAVPLTDQELAASRYDSSSLQGRDLFWLSGNGDMMRTDVETGVTETLNQLLHGIPMDENSDVVLAPLTPATMQVLVEDVTKRTVTLHVFSLEDGHQLRQEDLTRIRQNMKPTQRITSLVLNPR